MPIVHSEVITLRRRRTRDADALVTMLSETMGIITASTRSVMKTTSRYAGISQPFNRLDAVFYAKNEDQDIWTLTQASLIESFNSIQNDLNRIAYASDLCEWVETLSKDTQTSSRIWQIVMNFLKRWNQQEPCKEDLLFFQFHLLVDAGFKPGIDICLKCGKERSHNWRYIVSEGGLLCSSCGSNGFTISGGAIEILRRMMHSQQPLSNIRISPQQINEIDKLLQEHASYYAGLQSRSAIFHNNLENIQDSDTKIEAAINNKRFVEGMGI